MWTVDLPKRGGWYWTKFSGNGPAEFGMLYTAPRLVRIVDEGEGPAVEVNFQSMPYRGGGFQRVPYGVVLFDGPLENPDGKR